MDRQPIRIAGILRSDWFLGAEAAPLPCAVGFGLGTVHSPKPFAPIEDFGRFNGFAYGASEHVPWTWPLAPGRSGLLESRPSKSLCTHAMVPPSRVSTGAWTGIARLDHTVTSRASLERDRVPVLEGPARKASRFDQLDGLGVTTA